MPYDSLADLPDAVKNALPHHAQEIFRAAFNSAHDDHKGEKDAEERSFRIAWAAVKRDYEKRGDRWVKTG